jgi:hypothetical protein
MSEIEETNNLMIPELTIGTMNVRQLEVGADSVEATAAHIDDIFRTHILDILLLQDVNLALKPDDSVEALQMNLRETGITFEPNQKNKSQSNGDCAVAFLDSSCGLYKWKTKFSPDGRSIGLLLQFGRTRICVASVYMPPNPHAKHNVASRILHNAWRLGWSANGIILAGDYNAHLDPYDARHHAYDSDEWNYQHAKPFGPLCDFILDHKLTDAHVQMGVGGYTHRHTSAKGETESLKDRFLYTDNITCLRLYTESFMDRIEFSDHTLVVSQFCFRHCNGSGDGRSTMCIDDGSQEECELVEKRFKCHMRKYSPNKREYLVLYAYSPDGYSFDDIREDLELHGMNLQSHRIIRVSRDRIRIGWTCSSAAWESAATYIASEYLREN